MKSAWAEAHRGMVAESPAHNRFLSFFHIAQVVALAALLANCGELVKSDQPPQLPDPLSAFLAGDPDYRLLRVEDVPREVRPEAELGDWFHAVGTAELTGDGLVDVVAVLVRELPSPRFSLVAFHQTSPQRYSSPIWIARDLEEKILTLFIGDERRVTPAFCIECDSNPFMRWNGEEYEVEYWLPGERPGATTGTLPGGPVPLRAGPSDDAREVLALPDCASVAIEQALPKEGPHRWYRVRAQTEGAAIVGFLRNDSLTWTGCIG